MNTASLLIQNGNADWGPASALAELRQTFRFSVKTLQAERERGRELGRVAGDADLSLGGFVPDSAAILILPGGDFWTQGELPEVLQAKRAVIVENRPVAAICAATLAPAFFSRARQAGHHGKWPGAVRFRRGNLSRTRSGAGAARESDFFCTSENSTQNRIRLAAKIMKDAG